MEHIQLGTREKNKKKKNNRKRRYVMRGVFVATERDDVRNSALAFIAANIYSVSYTHLTLPTKRIV